MPITPTRAGLCPAVCQFPYPKKADVRQAKNCYLDLKDNRLTQAKLSLDQALNLLESLDIIIEN